MTGIISREAIVGFAIYAVGVAFAVAAASVKGGLFEGLTAASTGFLGASTAWTLIVRSKATA